MNEHHENEIEGWERAVVLELMREHQQVCFAHRACLRPLSICLNDSAHQWGVFDSSRNVIFISRRLVQEHSWDRVLGVLRHEMAHQWVAENAPKAYRDEPPHGPSFQAACQKLGVPEYFSRATVNMQSDGLDWRNETVADEKTERMIEKTRKLLSLATSGNENEAVLAMNRVREIYARYNLEEQDRSSRQGFVHLVMKTRKKRLPFWQQKVIQILNEHFFVQTLTYRQFDPETQQHPFAVELMGTRENVSMAEYAYHFLCRKVEDLLDEAANEFGDFFTRDKRHSYRIGILNGFSEKLKNSERAGRDEFTVIGQALIKFRGDPALQQYVRRVHPRLRVRRLSADGLDDLTYWAGHQAGRSINLNRPLESHIGLSGRMLRRPV